jgi:hypothetical protein
MPGKAFVIRFPSGDFEYDLTVTGRTLPAVGDTMRRKGVLWLVTRITQELVEVVHVERAETQKADAHVT